MQWKVDHHNIYPFLSPVGNNVYPFYTLWGMAFWRLLDYSDSQELINKVPIV